jgi:hypothetical protein
MFYAVIFITFPGQEPRSALSPIVSGLFVLIGAICGVAIAADVGKSLIMWRLFRPHDILILKKYREKEIARLNKKIEENTEAIEIMKKENIEMKRIVIDLS